MHLDHILVRRTELAETLVSSQFVHTKPAERYRSFVQEFPVMRTFFDYVRLHSGNATMHYVWNALWLAMEDGYAKGDNSVITALAAMPDELPWFAYYLPDCDKDAVIHWLSVLDDILAMPPS